MIDEGGGMMHRLILGLASAVIFSFFAIILTVPAVVDSAQPKKLNVKSNTFRNGGTLPMSTVFNSFGCTGGNRSPHISWSGEPPKTAAFALIMHDPDAPTGTGWYNWVVFNIPANVHELKEGAGAKGSPDLPAGAVLGLTDLGFSEYGGPCPPAGDKKHHYRFTLYALSSKVDGGPTTTGAALRFLTLKSTLATGTITGLYVR
jgi:Raf kinase inhibitor-like YbhB/YbcL family protein